MDLLFHFIIQLACQSKDHIEATFKNFSAGDYLILQNEINELTYIMEMAHAKDMKIVLNPSPMDEKIFKLPLDYVDFFMLNEIEAAQLVQGSAAPTTSHDLRDEDLLQQIQTKYPSAHIILTVGSRGAYYSHGDTVTNHGIFDVDVVDTTAAGDTFTGFFIYNFAVTGDAHESLRLASAASSIAVSRPGATTSIPTKEEVENFLTFKQVGIKES